MVTFTSGKPPRWTIHTFGKPPRVSTALICTSDRYRDTWARRGRRETSHATRSHVLIIAYVPLGRFVNLCYSSESQCSREHARYPNGVFRIYGNLATTERRGEERRGRGRRGRSTIAKTRHGSILLVPYTQPGYPSTI